MVGQLYRLTDVRRDSAYTIFYMGINVGAALGTILVGYLGQRIGWGYGFGLAGIGMLAGLVVFVLGKSALKGSGEAPAPLSRPREWTLYAVRSEEHTSELQSLMRISSAVFCLKQKSLIIFILS